MIKLKPFYRVDTVFDAVFLMSEYAVHRLPPEFSSIAEKLLVGIENPNDLTSIEVDQLAELHSLNVICVPPTKNIALSNFLELSGWGADYVSGQLDNMSVEIINEHPDMFWTDGLTFTLAEYSLIKPDPKLHIYVTDLDIKFDTLKYPALIVRVGSYKPSIGPLLTEQSPVEQFNTMIRETRGGFSDETFQADLPPYLRQLQLGLVTHEIMMFLVKVGNHAAASGVVDWNLKSMKRVVWKI
jgi:CBS domain-containing protein